MGNVLAGVGGGKLDEINKESFTGGSMDARTRPKFCCSGLVRFGPGWYGLVRKSGGTCIRFN